MTTSFSGCAHVLSHVGLFAIPWTVAHQAPLYGISQARILERIAISFSPGDLPDPGNLGFFIAEPPGELPRTLPPLSSSVERAPCS